MAADQFFPFRALAPLLLLFTVSGCYEKIELEETESEKPFPLKLSDDVDTFFKRKIDSLSSLLKNPEMIEDIRSSIQVNEKLTQSDILRKDDQWKQASPEGTMIQKFLTNRSAKILRDLKEKDQSFVEIFIADAIGLVVCMTNKTTDYNQADEFWWKDTFTKQEARHGNIEYDESARSRAISIYVPVEDPETNRTIGVCKAVINLQSIIDGIAENEP